MLELYVDAFRSLWEYPEFRSLFQLFRWLLLLAAVGMIWIGLLHVMFLYGFNTLLYRKRSPRPHWTRRLLPAIAAMVTILGGLYVISGAWIAAVS